MLAALWAASLVPFVGVASADARLVEAFATDEALQLNLLRGAAANHTFALTFGPYGHLVFNLILLVLRIIPGELSDARIVHTGRAISVVFAAATLWLTFVFARRSFGAAAAWVACAALGANATFYTWAAVLKPDMAQVFFLLLALALTCRLADEPRPRWHVLASCAAGLAFACKYSGLFVLPILGAVTAWRPVAAERAGPRVRWLRWLTAATAATLFAISLLLNAAWIASHLTEDGRIDAAVSPDTLTLLSLVLRGGAVAAGLAAATPWLWSALGRRLPLAATLWSWAVSAAVFAATFVVASPYSLRKAAFVKGLLGEASFAPPPLTGAWASTWFEGIGTAVGWPVFIVALCTMAGLVGIAARRHAHLGSAEWILTAWVILYALVLSAPVHEFYVHYGLPLAPAAAMLAGRGAVAAAGWAARSLGRRRLAPALLAASVLAIVAVLGRDVLAARTQLLDRERDSDAVYVGKWLECHLPESTRIAYDYFSYVPAAFPDATPTWGGTRAWLSQLAPDVVIVNNVTAAEVVDQAEHNEYYRCLAEETCGYAPVLAHGEFTLYARSNRAEALRTLAVSAAPGCEATAGAGHLDAIAAAGNSVRKGTSGRP